MAKPKPNQETFEVTKSDAEWKSSLTPEQYRVLREHGTERAGTSPLDKEHGQGTFSCAGCGLPLFRSETKFDSGTGWPSFYRPEENAVAQAESERAASTRTRARRRALTRA